jgi:hypothetical protein
MIELYYWPTPNGHKITLFLEESGLPYRIVPLEISKGAQFKPEFLAFNLTVGCLPLSNALKGRFEFNTEMDAEARGHIFRHASVR